MRTPVVLVAGQGDTDAVAGALLRKPGTVVVEHRFDGQVVRRTHSDCCDGSVDDRGDRRSSSRTAAWRARFATTCWCCCGNCTAATTSTGSWCTWRRGWSPSRSAGRSTTRRVRVAPGYVDGPAARDVVIAGVVDCVQTVDWLGQALSDDELVRRTHGRSSGGRPGRVRRPPGAQPRRIRRRWRCCAGWHPARESPSVSTASRWRWRTWTTFHAEAAAMSRTHRCWPDCRR